MPNLDVDKDGLISADDINEASNILEIELREEKANTQRHMAWVSLLAMIVFTVFLFLPIIPDTRVKALADLLGLFYLAQAGVVGAYMGVTAWMSNNSNGSSMSSRLSNYSQFNRPSQSIDTKVKGRD